MGRQILPALYNALGKAFNASPTELGYLTLARALVQALSSPLGGIAGVAHRSAADAYDDVVHACSQGMLMACGRPLLQPDQGHGIGVHPLGSHDHSLWALQLSATGHRLLGHQRHWWVA